MKFISQEKTEKNVVRLRFLIDKKVFDDATDKVFARKKSKITVQGFRPGKAPRHVIEKIYGKGVFYEDALNDLLPAEYDAALKESGVKAVASPSIDVEKIDEEGVLVIADVTVTPEVVVKDYKALPYAKETVKVTEKEIDAEIAQVRERQGREIEVTGRAAKTGDTANIDYEGFCDGVAFDGGKGEGYDLNLGSGTFIPGFEDQIVGHSIGEEFDVNVTFPTEYHSEELAGKAAVFKTKLNGIKETQLPELDDEFVKDVSEFDTMAEYRADVKAKLSKRKDEEADKKFESDLINALIEKTEVDIPEVMVKTEAENMLRDFDMNLRSNGLDLKSYLKYTGESLDDLREKYKPASEKQVKIRLALLKIAELEGLTATEEETEKEIADIAAANKIEVERVRQFINEEDLKNDLLSRKAMDLVKASAKKPRATKKTAVKKEDETPSDGE